MRTATLFCFGLGYSAGFLARAASAMGWRVSGTARERPAGESEFRLHRFDRDHPLADAASLLADATHVLVSIPPDAAGCPVRDLHGETLAALKRLAWLGYLSTTNVYGDRAGGWVDETSPAMPTGQRGHRRLAAEAAWLDLHRRAGLPLHIFRLAGIYGPGRSALDALKAGTARRIVKPGQVFSRIAVEDLAAVLLASMARPRPGAIYNVCDDEAAPPEAVVAYAASLLGVAPPPLEDFAAAALSPMARSSYDDNKRVSNRLIREELGVTLRYPTYREGLAALV
ncbi:MAG: SDR family oxidoreductase [Stellaceae bacterium]